MKVNSSWVILIINSVVLLTLVTLLVTPPCRTTSWPLTKPVFNHVIAHAHHQFVRLLIWAIAAVDCQSYHSVVHLLLDIINPPLLHQQLLTRKFPTNCSRLMPLLAQKAVPPPLKVRLTTRSPRELSALLETSRLLRSTKINLAVARNRRRRVTSASTARVALNSSTTCHLLQALLAFVPELRILDV